MPCCANQDRGSKWHCVLQATFRLLCTRLAGRRRPGRCPSLRSCNGGLLRLGAKPRASGSRLKSSALLLALCPSG